MRLARHTYGKGRVRVMRILRDTPRHEVRELTVKTMLEGAFGPSFTAADNSSVVATDTIKNIVNIVALEQVGASSEVFGQALATRFLERYAHVDQATVTAHETRWSRLSIDGMPHDHSFLLDGNGMSSVKVVATREHVAIESGVVGFTFMKSTGSGWEDFYMDDYTTLPETDDRICATAMDATWVWSSAPADYAATNARILDTALAVFATTYSVGVQDSLYRMGVAALEAVPEISQISMSCPNKHYLPINLRPFDLDNNNRVFTPTDEPHGQIECTIARE